MIFLSCIFFRNTNGISGIDLIRVGNVVQLCQSGYGCSESVGNFAQSIPGTKHISNIVRFMDGGRPGRPFGEMIQSGLSDDIRIIRKSPVKVHISFDTRHTALAGCTAIYPQLVPVETVAVAGVPESIALSEIISQIGVYKVPVAVKHGKVALLLHTAAETPDQLPGPEQR